MSRPILYFVLAVVVTFLASTAMADQTPSRPPLMLANIYQGQQPLSAYWVSEKLDGVRAYWDGKQLVSRQGNPFAAPGWFTSGFPDVPLDGELWMGRGTFSMLSGAVRRSTPEPAQWQQIRYMIFDMPDATGSFDQRLRKLKSLFARQHSPYLGLIEQFKVKNHDELMARLHEVVRGGGEGLVLHLGRAPYHGYRSDDLLKLKPVQDAEAEVLAWLPGTGKYQGMMGSLLVVTPEGQRFRVGTGFSDEQRAHPPAIGSIITYQYRGRTSHGLPRFPSFFRVRFPSPESSPSGNPPPGNPLPDSNDAASPDQRPAR